MKTLPRHLALLLGLALLFPAGALAKSHHKAHKPSCAKLTPLALDFQREPGQQSGMLSWRQPRAKVKVKIKRRGHKPRYVSMIKQFPASSFRVYRNGAVVGQTSKPWMTVKVKTNQQYAFQVRVVNNHGRQSGCRGASLSKAIPLLGPGQPRALTAVTVSDTSLTVNWLPGPLGDGKIVGYRVFRDGAALGQTSATSMNVSNLWAGRDYTFTVQAVDNAGRLSAPSLPLYTSTRPPIQTTGEVQAFLLATTDQSFKDLQAHYLEIGTIFPTYFDCDRQTGQLEGQDDPLVTGWAQRRGVRVLPRYNCQFSTTEHRIFTDPVLRQANIDALVAQVQQNNYDGINLDFEAAPATDMNNFTDFVRDLAARLHAIGRQLSVDVSPKTKDYDPNHPRGNTFDYAALSQYADSLFLMMWGAHWSSSWPGPLMDLGLTNQVLAYADTAIPDRTKWVLGAAMYGLDWPSGGGINHPATPREYADIMGSASQYNATPLWDSTSQEMHFNYTDSQGIPHEVWFENAQAIATRIGIAKQHGFGGLGVWHLGSEDQTIWSQPIMQPQGF